MKTALLAATAVTFFLFAGLMPDKANAQKPKNETQKIIIRSSGSEPMEFENLRDTTIISQDGKDTTIISTTQDGKEKKVTVRKIITSGSDKDNLHWVEAETEIQNEDDTDHVIISKSKDGDSRTIRIEKRIVKGDGTDSAAGKEIMHMELSGDEDIIFDEPLGKKHKTITIITSGGNEPETAGDENTTIIYLNDDPKCHHHKMKKGDGKHHKLYIIEEEKTIKKEE